MSGHRRLFVLASVVALAGTAVAAGTAVVLADAPPTTTRPAPEPSGDGCITDTDRGSADALVRLPLFTNHPDQAQTTDEGVGCDARGASAHRAYLLPEDGSHPRVIAFYQALASRDNWQPSGDGADFTTQAVGDYLCVAKDVAGQTAVISLHFNDGSAEGGSNGYTVDASFPAIAEQFSC